MNDEVLHLSTIGGVLRKRRRLLLALAAIGATVGVAASLLLPSAYESTSIVLLQGPREETEVLTEAQIAMSLVVLDRTVAGLGWDITGASLSGSVTAEVTEGNVIEIRARAESPTRARELTERVTEEYITFSTEIVTRAANATSEVLQKRKVSLEQRTEEFNLRISELQGQFQLLSPGDPQGAGARAELEQLRATREDAFSELDDIDQLIGAANAQAAVSRENIRVIEPAVAASGAVPPTGLQLVAGGAVLAAALGAFVLVASRHNDRRLRRRADIAAAVDAPVLGTVEAPAATPVEPSGTDSPSRKPHGWRSWIKWLAGEEPRPTSSRDEALDHLRYRRVLAQLPTSPPGWARLLVVVVDADMPASRAVARLTITAALDDRAVSLVTDSLPIAETVEAFRSGSAHRLGPIKVLGCAARDETSPPEPATMLNVVPVSATRPTVPSCPDLSGALLVVTSGTATASEMFGIAEACRDADCPVAGVLLVVTDADEDEGEEPRPLPPPRLERLGPQRRELQALGTASNGHLANGEWKQPGDA